jgi:2-polyprenyl-3-methyl-5-hydroxy-6-metoxy-1,4-benzoquinol methylase
MDYLEQLVQNMDPADRERLEGGRYFQLLEAALPPKTHPRYRAWHTHALSGIERGRVQIEIVSRFSREIRGARVLDFGCGDGGLAVAFARAGARVTAIDSDPGRVERTRALAEDFGQEVDVRQDREFGEGLPAQSFDIIVCNDVIEHVEPFSRLAQSHARLLKPEGVLNLNPPEPVFPAPAPGRSPFRAVRPQPGRTAARRLLRHSGAEARAGV